MNQIRTYGKTYTQTHTQIRTQSLNISIRYISFCYIADKVVKVPQMAESISEGTLKQWVKRK